MRISILLLPLLALQLAVPTLAEPGADAAASKSTSKSSEKGIFPKKVTSLKKRPTKTPSITTIAAFKPKKPLASTVFQNLTADDLEFIKELDHQFSVHGDKIKIKVERTNATETKNLKRTIDGALGYGYAHNGYDYDRPKFMFYPYSQKDIAPDSPGYYPKEEHTSVTIEPSYSYELKPQTYEEPTHPQIDLPAHQSGKEHQPQPQEQQYEEPVIVLRIPGPAKYATHLQSLLQQYLEIRAAQYLRILENSELQQQQHQQPEQQVEYEPPQPQVHAIAPQQYESPPQHVEYQPQQHAIAPLQYEQPEAHVNYQQQVAYAHQDAGIPESIQYPAIDDVYHSYKERHHQHQHQQAETYAEPPHQQQLQQQHYHHHQASYQDPQTAAPHYYYMHNQHYAAESPHAGEAGQSYQNVYLIAMSSPEQSYGAPELSQHHMQQPIYVQDEHHAHVTNEHEQHFDISENSPRETHTKIFFSMHNQQNEYPSEALPSIRPHERHAPVTAPTYQHQHQHQHQQHAEESAQSEAATVGHHEQHAVEQQQQQQQAQVAQQDEVTITQRPHNYHAHPSHKQRGRTRISTKRAASALKGDTDQQLEQIHAYVTSKFGAKTGNQEAYKTTKII